MQKHLEDRVQKAAKQKGIEKSQRDIKMGLEAVESYIASDGTLDRYTRFAE